MKRYEVTYVENGKVETIDIYGFKSFETFVEENGEFVDIMQVEELDIQKVTQEDEEEEEEAFNILKKEIERFISEEGMTDIEIALILSGAVGMIRMLHEKFYCSFSEDLVKKFEDLFIIYRYGR